VDESAVCLVSLCQGDAAPMVQQLLAPLLACFTAAWAADTDKDNPYAQEENHYLFRSFLSLMAAVVTNNLVDVLLSQDQGVQQQALDWVIQGTYHDPDPTVITHPKCPNYSIICFFSVFKAVRSL